MRFFRVMLVLAVFTGLFAPPAEADTIIFNDRDAFNAAAEPNVLLNITGIGTFLGNDALIFMGELSLGDFLVVGYDNLGDNGVFSKARSSCRGSDS